MPGVSLTLSLNSIAALKCLRERQARKTTDRLPAFSKGFFTRTRTWVATHVRLFISPHIYFSRAVKSRESRFFFNFHRSTKVQRHSRWSFFVNFHASESGFSRKSKRSKITSNFRKINGGAFSIFSGENFVDNSHYPIRVGRKNVFIPNDIHLVHSVPRI